MDSNEFIEAVKLHVRDSAIKGLISNLKDPPGRRVSSLHRTRSDWYKNLSVTDTSYVDSIIRDAVHDALFGLFAVFDGTRSIEDGGNKGNFKLTYEGSCTAVLNDPMAIGLNELFNATD